MITLDPDVGYFEDTPRAISGSLSMIASRCFRLESLAFLLGFDESSLSERLWSQCCQV